MLANTEPEKLLLLCSLYVSQYIPIMFLVQALPVFMRGQGVSLDMIGLIALLGLPLILKFLWSPIIDRYGFTPWGHYRFWILMLQSLATILTVICAFIDIEKQFSLLMIFAFAISCLCATQDIATDALAVGLLKPEERGFGNGIQTAGHFIGAIMGGGAMLIILNQQGWTVSLLIMAAMMILALIPVGLYREPPENTAAAQAHQQRWKNLKSFYLSAIVNFTRRPDIKVWMVILFLYMMGGNMAGTMFRPLLVDYGFSLADIGFVEGIVGHASGIAGALFAGLLITGLGRKRSLLFFGAMNGALMTLYLLPQALDYTDIFTFYYIAIGTQFGLGAAGTVLLTVIMDRSDISTAGTDFTVQTSILYLGSIGGSAISGVIADRFGYQGAFLTSIGIAVVVLAVIAGASERQMFRADSPDITALP
jgi:MFS family permease